MVKFFFFSESFFELRSECQTDLAEISFAVVFSRWFYSGSGAGKLISKKRKKRRALSHRHPAQCSFFYLSSNLDLLVVVLKELVERSPKPVSF